MKNKKIILLLSVFEIIAVFSSSAYAVESPIRLSPESQLIEQIISIEGQSQDSHAMDDEVVWVGREYLQATQAESDDERAENLSSALASMGIATPAQASALVQQIRNTSDERELATVLSQSKGAQFSECSQSTQLASVMFLLAGGVAGSWGLGGELGQSVLGDEITKSTVPLIYGGFGVAATGVLLMILRARDCA